MLSPMLIPRPMLMLLLGVQVMDTGLLGTLDTTIPTHMFCTDVRREKLMLNLMLTPKLMLKHLHITGFMDIGPDITPVTTTTPDIHITGMENKSMRERLLSVTVKI